MRLPTLSTPVAAALLTALAAVIWGTSFPVNYVGVQLVDPGTFAALRFLVAAVLAAGTALVLGRFRGRLFLRPGVWFLGFLNAVGFLLQYEAQVLTSPAKTALIVNANAIVVAVLAVVLLRERLAASVWACVGLAFAGVALLTTGGSVDALSGGSALGDALAFLSGAAWSLFIVLKKRFLDTDEMGGDVLELATVTFTTTAVILLPAAFLLAPATFLAVPALGWWPILYSGALCSLVAYLLWGFGLRHMRATTASVILLLEIPVAAVLSVSLGYERVTLAASAGALLLFAAIAYVSLWESRRGIPE